MTRHEDPKAKPTLCRVVTLASDSGKYGGPFDTATRQVRIARRMGIKGAVHAGYLPGDEPQIPAADRDLYVLTRTHQLIRGRDRYSTLLSASILLRLWREIGKADVVHISLARDLIPVSAATIALIRRRRVISQPHGMLTSRRSRINSVADLVVRPILRRSAFVIVLTTTEASDLQRLVTLDNKRLRVLGNPIPHAHAQVHVDRSITDRPKIAIFIARLHPRKRVSVFIDAAKLARSASRNEEYRIVGPDGGDLQLVQASAQEYTNIVYRGAVSERAVLDELQQAGVFVLTSENEPWGNVLVAAMTLGIPVILTESAALAEVIKLYKAGIVVPDNDPEAVSDAVHSVLVDKTLSQSLATQAKVLIRERMSEEVQIRTLGELYGLTSRESSVQADVGDIANSGGVRK